MGLYSETKQTAHILIACLAVLVATAQLPVAVSGESAAAAPSPKTKSTAPNTQQSPPVFRARIKDTDSSSRNWNRTLPRPSGLWTSSQVDRQKQSNIRFASASGMDESGTSAVDESTLPRVTDPAETADPSLTDATEMNTTSVESPTPTASSASVKEQLLNALRKQREAIANPNALKPTTPPGSLTIMNSPRVTPKSLNETGKLTIPQSSDLSSKLPTPTNQTDVTAESHESAMPPRSAKSYAGLTRTLEEDLKSNNPYLRERAQKLLRLQMQILQLRSRQAADAETTAPMTINNTDDASTPGNPGKTGDETPPLNPSGDPIPGSGDATSGRDEAKQLPSDDLTQNSDAPNALTSNDQTASDGNTVIEDMTDEQNSAVSAPSANAALLQNVVVDGPIDRLGLANNLFAVAEYPLALEMYQQATGPELSSQQKFWVEYQLANCLRRLGNPAEASNRYRKLASQPEAGWLSQQARWWVETLEQIRILEKVLKDNSVEQSRKLIEDTEAAVVEPPAENTATSTVSEPQKNLEPANDEPTN